MAVFVRLKKNFVCRWAMIAVFFCGIFGLATPSWAQTNRPENCGCTDEVQKINKKIDLMIDKLNQNGLFDEQFFIELNKIDPQQLEKQKPQTKLRYEKNELPQTKLRYESGY